MSTHEPQQNPSSTGPEIIPTTLDQAGISRSENGNYILPPILVEYRGGDTQNLIIEVGEQLSQITAISGASVMTVAQMLRNNAAANNAQQGQSQQGQSQQGQSQQGQSQARAQAQVQQTNPLSSSSSSASPITTPAPILTSPLASTPTNTNIDIPSSSTINQDTANNNTATSNSGVRGLDFPAFDVSSDGVYNDDSQPASRFLAPLQRVFERVYGQHNNLDNVTNQSRNENETETETETEPEHEPSNTEGSSNNNVSQSQSPSLAESRNIILTVNYVYGGANDSTEGNSGSLLLYVPSINETNEENVSVLVRLATEIALRTIAVTLRKSAGVSKETFDSLEVKKIKDLKENQLDCSICYENYVEKEESKKDNKKKRKLDNDKIGEEDEDEEDEGRENSFKRSKSNDGSSIPNSHSGSNIELNKDSDHKEHSTTYTHYPIALKCGHIFGASCLNEWFKTNSSCPLCREKIPSLMETANNGSRYITITLPNLARIISNSRPLIENFNNRQMTFSMSDDDESNTTNIITTAQSPNSNISDQLPRSNLNPNLNNSIMNTGVDILDRLSNLRNIRSRTNQDSNESETNDTPVNRQRLVNFIRDIVSSLSNRSNDAQNANSDNIRIGNTRTNARIPIERRVLAYSPQFPGFFPPLGVESRRTANGVETREISMFGNNNVDQQVTNVPEATGTSNNDETNNTTANTNSTGNNDISASDETPQNSDTA